MIFLTTHAQRRRGLRGMNLPPGVCAALTPARQIHTWGMDYALDIVFVDRAGRIVELVRELPPRRISPWVRSAFRVFELRAGALPAALAIDDQLVLKDL